MCRGEMIDDNFFSYMFHKYDKGAINSLSSLFLAFIIKQKKGDISVLSILRQL